MPESISSAKLPVGIIISPTTSRTSTGPHWSYLWNVDREPEQEPWRRRLADEIDERPGGPFD